MSCNDYQLQMSLCLDGRLPAGTRAGVLAHVAECEDCSRTWNDLEKAQELVLNLPVHATSRDFRQTLWARIESGEGSPEITLHEPVSVLTKARYLLAGAAAAALLLVGGRLLWPSTPSSTPSSAPRDGALVAQAPAEKSAEERSARGTPLHPREPLALAGLQELNPLTLADDLAHRTASNVRTLRARLCEDSRPMPRSYVEPEVQRAVSELRASAEMLRWLREDGLLGEMPAKVEADLRFITAANRSTDSHLIQTAICEGAELENLPSMVSVRLRDPSQFLSQMRYRLESNPSLKQHFFLHITPPAGTGSQPVVFFQFIQSR